MLCESGAHNIAALNESTSAERHTVVLLEENSKYSWIAKENNVLKKSIEIVNRHSLEYAGFVEGKLELFSVDAF